MTEPPDKDPQIAADEPEAVSPPDDRQQQKERISGSEKRRRRHLKFCRFDDDELAEFERRARSRKLSNGAFIRASTLDTPGPRSQRNQPTAASQQRAQLLTALMRMGNNLNQGVRALHEIKLAAPAATERDRLAYELEALRKVLEKLLEDTEQTTRAVIDEFDHNG